MLTGNANLKYDAGAVLIYTNSNSPPSTTVWWVLASMYNYMYVAYLRQRLKGQACAMLWFIAKWYAFRLESTGRQEQKRARVDNEMRDQAGRRAEVEE